MGEHSRKNLRQARRLGIDLYEVTVVESSWTTFGEDTIYDGHGNSERVITRDPRSETWTVSIRGRKYAEGVSLKVAMEVSRFLARRANRAAWRGTAPKAHADAALKAANEHLSAEGRKLLTDLLSTANGGAVTVR